MADPTSSSSQGTVLFLHAQTSLHPGSGTALGVVDLPVQRERHTAWPLIPGSALKGVLRDRCRERLLENYAEERETDGKLRRTRRRVTNEDDPKLVAVFGPGKISGDEGNSHAGALAITDARILAFPVRSLKGVFAWVTSPAVLGRVRRDLSLASQTAPPDSGQLDSGQALCPGGSPLLVEGQWLVLEEFEFKVAQPPSTPVGEIAEWISTHAVEDSFTRDRLKTHLVVLADDDFNHFVRHATEVSARIALDYDRKTVKDGALFYQEFLPPETLFYSLLLAHDSRQQSNGEKQAGAEMKAGDVLAWLRERVPGVLQIGGDETTGKGLCAVRIAGEETR